MKARRAITLVLLASAAGALALVSGVLDVRIDWRWGENSASAIDLFGSEGDNNAEEAAPFWSEDAVTDVPATSAIAVSLSAAALRAAPPSEGI